MSDDQPNIDPALSLMVNTVNELTERQEDGPGVTLTVQGLIVTGMVIPDWQWFEDVEHQCHDVRRASGASADTTDDGRALLFKTLRDELVEIRAQAKIVAAVTEDLPLRYQQALFNIDRTVYIHLRDARAIPTGSATPIPTSDGIHWRGKLAEVSGWSFGVPARA